MLEQDDGVWLKGRLQIETVRNALTHCNVEPSLVSSLSAFLAATSCVLIDIEPNQAPLVAIFTSQGKKGAEQREAIIDALLFQHADEAADTTERLMANFLLEMIEEG